MLRKKKFLISDFAQQMLGGFLLAGPFVVTEEVWRLASKMTFLHSIMTIIIVLLIGFGALYKADSERDLSRERELVGIPLRFISLIVVSYLSVIVLSLVFAAPATFEVSIETFFKAISIGSIFSVIGAATADSLL